MSVSLVVVLIVLGVVAFYVLQKKGTFLSFLFSSASSLNGVWIAADDFLKGSYHMAISSRGGEGGECHRQYVLFFFCKSLRVNFTPIDKDGRGPPKMDTNRTQGTDSPTPFTPRFRCFQAFFFGVLAQEYNRKGHSYAHPPAGFLHVGDQTAMSRFGLTQFLSFKEIS
jgi:hypothetical protein